MIHASDHEEAPILMVRAHQKAIWVDCPLGQMSHLKDAYATQDTLCVFVDQGD